MEPGIWRMAFKTKIIKEIEFESIRMAEDQIFLLDLDLANRQVFFSTHVLYSYTVGNSNQLTSNSEAKQELDRAIKLIQRRISLGYIHVNEFTALMLVKLNLSFIKASAFKTKRVAIYDLLKSLKLIGGFRRMTIFYLLITINNSFLRRFLNAH